MKFPFPLRLSYLINPHYFSKLEPETIRPPNPFMWFHGTPRVFNRFESIQDEGHHGQDFISRLGPNFSGLPETADNFARKYIYRGSPNIHAVAIRSEHPA